MSISSTFRALETVNLKSLLSSGVFNFSLVLPTGLLSFLIKSLVAFCSINFLSKFFLFASGLILVFGDELNLLKVLLFLNVFFFSTEKDFLPED